MAGPTLEEVLAELRDLRQTLSELPDDAFGERLEVKERRRELHAHAAELRKTGRSIEELQEELRRLRSQRDEVFQRHLSLGNIGPGGGEGGGGIEVRYALEVNRTIDEVGDLAGINRQIRELEVEINRRRAGEERT